MDDTDYISYIGYGFTECIPKGARVIKREQLSPAMQFLTVERVPRNCLGIIRIYRSTLYVELIGDFNYPVWKLKVNSFK